MLNKIEPSDLIGKGVLGQSDVPGLSIEDMQKAVEGIPREVIIPIFNALIDALKSNVYSDSGADNIGATAIPSVSGNTVQSILEGLKAYADSLALDAGAVTSVFGRAGAVLPQAGDYTAAMVGARAHDWFPTPAEINSAPALQNHTTVYVATNGDDTTGEGTSAQPYKTISKAISVIPKVLNGYTATINIAPGNYAEDVAVSRYGVGILLFETSGTVNINSISIQEAYNVRFTTGTFVFGNGNAQAIHIVGSNVYVYEAATISVVGTTGIGLLTDFSILYVNGTVTLGSNSYGISIRAASSAFFSKINGGTATIGIAAQSGGDLSYASASYTASTMQQTTNGGRIRTGV